MDLNFHLAQAYIARLQYILDRVPITQSIIKYLSSNPDCLDLVTKIEFHLKEALSRVTPASNETVQDGYLYFYSCLKMAEFKMLIAALDEDLDLSEREEVLKLCVGYLVDASRSRPYDESLELHYICLMNLSQLLLSVKRYNITSKAYGKLMLILSALINRSFFTTDVMHGLLLDEAIRHASQALVCSSMLIKWSKLHIGPLILNEKVTAGYASWSFEDLKSVSKSSKSSQKNKNNKSFFRFSSKSNKSSYKPSPSKDDASSTSSIAQDPSPFKKASPPKSVPPLLLPPNKGLKIHMHGSAQIHPNEEEDDHPTKPRPPAGPVPLFALGHKPVVHDDDNISISDSDSESDIENGDDWYPGVYGKRMRRRVPPGPVMAAIENENLQTYRKSVLKTKSLLPNFTNRKESSAQEKALGDDASVGSKTSKSATQSAVVLHPASTWSKNKFANAPNTLKAKNKIEKIEEEDEEESSEEGDEKDPNAIRRDEDDESELSGLENDDISNDGAGNNRNAKQGTKGILVTSNKTGGGNQSQQNKKIKFAPQVKDGKTKNISFLTRIFRSLVAKSDSAELKAALKKKQSKSLLGNPLNKNLNIHPHIEEFGFWASSQCYYNFMILSRLSRMDIVLQSQKLEVLDGERANYNMYNDSDDITLKRYFFCRKFLFRGCVELVTSPLSLKDLNQRSYLELSIIFKSQEQLFKAMV